MSTKGVHCEDCRHGVRNYMRRLVRPAIVIAIVGLALLLLKKTEPGIVLLILGAGLGALGYWLHQEQYVAVLKNKRPPVPVMPQCSRVSIRETVRGRIRLDADGRYTAEVTQQRGEITLPLAFTPADQERCDAYQRKYQLGKDDLTFHAGFAVLEGAASMTFGGDTGAWVAGERILALTGNVAEQPFLSGKAAPGSNQWQVRHTYEIPLRHESHDGRAPRVPVRLIPSLVPELARKGLELELQWALSFFDGGRAHLGKIDALQLLAPGSLGKVEQVDPAALIGTAVMPSQEGSEEPGQSIQWKNLTVNEEDRQANRKIFFMRFPTQVDPQTRLTGRARVRFDGSLSGLEGVRLYYPLGQPRGDVETDIQTLVEVDFELDLAALRYQDTVLDKEEITREGVIPDHVMVGRLIDDISQEGFYIKRVIENPARTSKAGAHVLNRFWDLAGRKYDGVYPMDFHLVLTGEEVYGREGRAQSGKTQIEVTVQGTATDETMKAQVGNLKEQLVRLIEGALEEMPVMKAPPPPSVAPLEAEPRYDDAGTAERARTLRERLDKLEVALIEQRISEDTYHTLREKYEQELNALLGTF
ncbi:MAG: hypothetical protein ISS50_00125 [Anaerolineae bacterium]|nr:hypothetical protein [Anaerolineae bacterium]